MGRRGYIHDKLDLKILELYILAKAAGPLAPNTLADLVIAHEGVGYFDFVEATHELVETGHLLENQEGFSITEKGRTNSAATESSLPYSVRRRCGLALAPINAALRLHAQIQGKKFRSAQGEWRARLTLDDDGGNLLTLELLCPSEKQADRIIASFLDRPEQIFNEVLEALSTPSEVEEDIQPPAESGDA